MPSSNLPEGHGRASRPSYLVLLQTGYAELAASPRQLVGSCPTVSPLPPWGGGLLSVALSEGRPPWVLPSVLPCGARTFLSGPKARSDGLSGSRELVCGSSRRNRRSFRNYLGHFNFEML